MRGALRCERAPHAWRWAYWGGRERAVSLRPRRVCWGVLGCGAVAGLSWLLGAVRVAMDETPPRRNGCMPLHKGNPAISWHVGVVGLHGLHWTPFQALRACWHACPTCQSIVPVCYPITERRFHHSRTSRGSPQRPRKATEACKRHSFEVTRTWKPVTMRTTVTSSDDQHTCTARPACISAANESAPNKWSSADVATPEPQTSCYDNNEDITWGSCHPPERRHMRWPSPAFSWVSQRTTTHSNRHITLMRDW